MHPPLFDSNESLFGWRRPKIQSLIDWLSWTPWRPNLIRIKQGRWFSLCLNFFLFRLYVDEMNEWTNSSGPIYRRAYLHDTEFDVAHYLQYFRCSWCSRICAVYNFSHRRVLQHCSYCGCYTVLFYVVDFIQCQHTRESLGNRSSSISRSSGVHDRYDFLFSFLISPWVFVSWRFIWYS